uniref:BPTI/Kunitz inhibitor domain-containing protein n=1 Tax=Ditylenchus dipsaci TaxID=166011 RepID=A0A915E845_9BILA
MSRRVTLFLIYTFIVVSFLLQQTSSTESSSHSQSYYNETTFNSLTSSIPNNLTVANDDSSFLSAMQKLIFGNESKNFFKNLSNSKLPGLALAAAESAVSAAHHSSAPYSLGGAGPPALIPDNTHHYHYQGVSPNVPAYGRSYPTQYLAGSATTSPAHYHNKLELVLTEYLAGTIIQLEPVTHQECEQQCEQAGSSQKPNTVVYVPFTLTFTMRPTGSPNPIGGSSGISGPAGIPATEISGDLVPTANSAGMSNEISSSGDIQEGNWLPPSNPNSLNELTSTQYKPEPLAERSYPGLSVQPAPASLLPAKAVCEQDLDSGHGASDHTRYYFNPNTKLCEEFQFRGNGGNLNNFLDLDECQRSCRESPNPCAYGTMPQPVQCQPGSVMSSTCTGQQFCHVGATPLLLFAAINQAETHVVNPWTKDKAQPSWLDGIGVNSFNAVNHLSMPERKELKITFVQRRLRAVLLCRSESCKLPIQMPLVQCVPGPETCGGRRDLWCHIGATQQTTVCCPAEAINRCSQPMEQGVGNAKLERWFYNSQMGQCQAFSYAGLKGNQNNFMTRMSANLAVCQIPVLLVRRPALNSDGRAQSCAVSASLSTCPMNHWCHIGVDTTTTVCCPDASPNPCQLPMSSGEGAANLERFHYDQATKTCKPFTYKGLKGNQNNYLSLRACQLACQPLDNPCIGQPATSSSGQVLFCSSTNKDTCPVNFWCHLGANPETTVCCPGATNPCSVPLAPGTGNAGLARWYYNPDDRECVSFQYNGKRGNQNNFLSQTECQRTCPGIGRQTRYAFNRQTGQCVAFEYTGCGGNLNNFLTMADCTSTCGAVGF